MSNFPDETGPVSDQAESMRGLAGQIYRVANTLDEVVMNARAMGETDLEVFLNKVRTLLQEESVSIRDRAVAVESAAKARVKFA